MKQELDEKLCKKYPKIFAQRGKPMNQTAMCWGFQCGDGWYDIIDNLCAVIDNFMYNEKGRAKFEKRKPYAQIEASTVKEKFGGLRFYTNHTPDEVSGAISMAERMSYKICEYCGSTKNISQTKGWVITLCEKCMGKREKKFQRRRLKNGKK